MITRPEPGASRTADAVRAIGMEPIVCPLTEIVAVRPNLGKDAVEAFDVVAVTSANALRHVPEEILGLLRGKPVHVVGEATGRLAKSLGLEGIHVADGDAGALAEQLIAETQDGQMIGYIAGRQRTGTLEAGLANAGRKHAILETYETHKVSCITYNEAVFSSGSPPNAILVHSGLALDVLIDCATSGRLSHPFENTQLFLIAERLAKTVPATLFRAVHVANHPTDEALIARLKAAFSN